VFVRALCAVSQEELEQGHAARGRGAAIIGGGVQADGGGGPAPINIAAGGGSANTAALPQLFSLQKAVECAHGNAGRIRLVWTRLWAVIAAQLVGASCSTNRCGCGAACACLTASATEPPKVFFCPHPLSLPLCLSLLIGAPTAHTGRHLFVAAFCCHTVV
jgi:hypothetical protein